MSTLIAQQPRSAGELLAAATKPIAEAGVFVAGWNGPVNVIPRSPVESKVTVRVARSLWIDNVSVIVGPCARGEAWVQRRK